MFGIRLDMPGVRDAAGAALSELGLAEERLTAMQGQQRQQQHANGTPRSAAGPAGTKKEADIEPEHIGAFLARVRLRRALIKVSHEARCRICRACSGLYFWIYPPSNGGYIHYCVAGRSTNLQGKVGSSCSAWLQSLWSLA